MGSGFAKQKKQAKAMQQQFAQIQNRMAQVEVEGSAGNGLVTLKLNGVKELTSLKIKPECVDPQDVEGLEDLIRAAYADALGKMQDEQKLSSLMG